MPERDENQRRVDELIAELERARAEARENAQALAALKAEHRQAEQLLQAKAERAEEEAATHRKRLQQIYASRTWKVGWILIGAGRILRHPRRVLRRFRAQRATVPDTPAARARRMPGAVAEYALNEDEPVRDEYLRAAAKTEFVTGKTHLAIAVYTTDFAEGRGDVYTAVGLGRFLERIGYEVVYLPRGRWYDLPANTDLYLAMLDTVDLLQVPANVPAIAWVRNRTQDWIATPSLPLYDGVLCSSEISRSEIARAYSGPLSILRIGVDAELFNGGEEPTQRHGITSTVNQWGRERQIYRALRRCRLDFPLAIYGQQRGISDDLKPCWRGPVSYFSLPSLYRQVSLVLDDHNHSTQPYGNVNSRLFESLALGAPVVTNSSVGLREAGLDAVPVYSAPEELDEVIHEHLRAPAALLAQARSLREIVLERHTYERRAAEFDAFAKDVVRGGKGSWRGVVTFFPDYTAGNPYQRLLYSRGPATGIAAVPYSYPAPMPPRLAGLGSQLIFHLHWTAPILSPAETEGEARERARSFLHRVDALRAAGSKFAWTIHNVLPHECRFPDIESDLRQELAQRADMIHVMCPETAELVSPRFTLPPERVRVVPHPSYVDVYPNLMDQEQARAELGLSPDHTVFCFFGGVRPYKGLDTLLDAFEYVCQAKPESRLIIVGPAPPLLEGVDEMLDRCERNPFVIANFNRVADSHIQIYLNAADAVVLPHRAVLNSGSAMLAFSFARPVISPKAGCVADLITPDVGIAYDAGDADALRNAMMRADELKDDRFRKAAYEKARTLSYPAVSEQFFKAAGELLSD